MPKILNEDFEKKSVILDFANESISCMCLGTYRLDDGFTYIGFVSEKANSDDVYLYALSNEHVSLADLGTAISEIPANRKAEVLADFKEQMDEN